MMLAIALLGLLAQADDAKEEVYKRLAIGDRVEISFRSGRTIAGKVVAPAGTREKVESIDFTKEKSLTVDVSLEYPGLNGTMTVKKDEVRSLRILGELSERDRKNLEEQKKLIEEERKRAEERPPAPKPPPQAEKPPAEEKPKEKDPAAEAEKKRQEDLKKGEALYLKYPPPAWGPDRNTAIRIKKMSGIVVPPIELEFHENFALWDLWRLKLEADQKKVERK